MASPAARPPLAFIIPTYNRKVLLERTLRKLATDPGVQAHRVPVLVSDNASPDRTPDVVRALQAEFPDFDLRLQVQPENIGAKSYRWLVENAPEADYVWSLADDDWPAEGAVDEVVALLARHDLEVLHLPHCWEKDGRRQLASPCPPELELFPTSRELFLKYTHWLSFMSATVVRREALQRAADEAPSEDSPWLPFPSPWLPHIWFVVAGRSGPCAVAPKLLVIGDGSGVSWGEMAKDILGREVIRAYDVGFHLVVDEMDFGIALDGRYANQRFIEVWAQTPIDELAAAVARFPTSAELRMMLYKIARSQQRRDLYAVVDEAAVAAGAAARADAHIAEGERCFGQSDFQGAVAAFNAAVAMRPTSAEAWNDLAVALHAIGRPEAVQAVDAALEIDPQHPDALENRARLVLAPA